jgi:hypothetical protein
MKSTATTPEEYLDSLPPERRETVERVRAMVLANLPEGYREGINWGMLTYEIPLERYPNTYNDQPLTPVALAAQKNYFSLYLMIAYDDPAQMATLRAGFDRIGRKMDMGKSCLRFRNADDIPLDSIGELIGQITPEKYIEQYEASRRR